MTEPLSIDEGHGSTEVPSEVVEEVRTKPEPILVRATVHLSGLPLGRYAWVDPADPYIRGQIALTHLVPEDDDADADTG